MGQTATCPTFTSLGAAGATVSSPNITSGVVSASTWWDSDGDGPLPAWLVVGGSFTFMDGVRARNIAAWDGTQWRAIGDGPGNPDPSTSTNTSYVRGLSVINNQLYAAGRFISTTPSTRAGVARWTGSAWEFVADGLNLRNTSDEVRSLVEYQGEIYAGGSFQIFPFTNGYNVAKLFQGQWIPVRDGLGNQSGPTRGVRQLLVHNNELYAAGNFSRSVALPVDPVAIAKLGATAWERVGTELVQGASAEGFAMLSEPQGLLLAGLLRVSPGTQSFGQIARFDGTSWTSLTPQLGAAGTRGVNSMARFGSSLYATAEQVFTPLRVEGETFVVAGEAVTTTNDGARPLIIVGSSDGTRGNLPSALIMGGSNDRTETTTTFGLGNWRTLNSLSLFAGSLHQAITRSPDRLINDLLTFQGRMIAVGTFFSAGGKPMYRIGAFDGTRWSALDDGSDPANPGLNDRGLTAVEWNNKLVVGGIFSRAGSLPAQRVAAWNGTTWENLGSIPETALVRLTNWNGRLLALCGDGVIRLGESFVPVLREWNGTSWVLFGNLPSDAASGAFVVGADLYRNSALPAALQRWTGSTWESLPSTPTGPAFYLATYRGELLATTATSDLYALRNGQWVQQPQVLALSTFLTPVFNFVEADGLLLAVGRQRDTIPTVAAYNGAFWGSLGNLQAFFSGGNQGLTCTDALTFQGRTYIAGTMAGIIEQQTNRVISPAFTLVELTLPAQPTTFRALTPVRSTVPAGSSLVLAAETVQGAAPAPRWQRNGVLLSDGRQPDGTIVEGAQTNTLTLRNLTPILANGDSFRFLTQPLPSSPCANFNGPVFSVTVTRACDPIDFNNDALFPSDADLVDFFSVIAGGPCSTQPPTGNGCNDIDFNNDGLFPSDDDLVSFLRVLAGGEC